MTQIARIGDPVSCGDTVAQGSGNVFSNGLPVSRKDVDFTAGHGCNPPINFPGGSPTVFANNLPVLRVGDNHNTHACPSNTPHGGSITAGSQDVYVE